MTLPTLAVLLDNGTGTFPYDISRFVLAEAGHTFNRGRADWQGGVTAGTLNLTLNNSDGRFTPGSTLIASPSPIRVDQRIRLRETVNGVTYTRFTGYVKSWPVAWPATVGTYAESTITVTDGQARAERRVLRSLLVEEVLSSSPSAYWPLSEDVDATTAADISGNQAPVLVQGGTGLSVLFGEPDGGPPGGGTAATVATFSGGKYLYAPTLTSTTSGAIEVWFSTTTNDATQRVILTSTPTFGGGSNQPAFYLLNGHAFYGDGTDLGFVADGNAHLVYIGAEVGAGAPGAAALDGTGVIGVTGPGAGLWVGGYPGFAGFIGTMSHVARYVTSPGFGVSAQQTLVGSSLYVTSEAGPARMARFASYAGISTGTMDTGLTNVTYTDVTGTTAWSQIQTITDSEVGVTYVDGSGALVFHNRNRVAAKTTPDLSLVANQYITPDVQPVDDDQQIINYLEASSTVTGVTQVVRDLISELGDGTATHPGHGQYSDSRSYPVSTDAEVLDRANWIVTNFAEPSTRYGTLTINLYAMPVALASSVLAALDLDCWLRVTQMAPQNTGGTTIDIIVEGFTEQATASSWTVSCNVVARSVFNAWILGDSTYGVLGTTTELYI